MELLAALGMPLALSLTEDAGTIVVVPTPEADAIAAAATLEAGVASFASRLELAFLATSSSGGGLLSSCSAFLLAGRPQI